MGTTPIYGIPYVEPTDALAVYPAQDKAQAEAVESAIAGGGGWVSGGTGSTVFAANATNFTLTASAIRQAGGRVSVNIAGTMKVALTVSTAGRVPVTPLGQMATAYRPGSQNQGLGTGHSGRLLGVYIGPDGTISLQSCGGTVNIGVGEAIYISGSYIL